MKNLKLALATTLSLMALSFAGTASADSSKKFKNYKQQNVITKTTYTKKVNRYAVKHKIKHARNNKKVVKRVVVKHTPNKRVVITKRIVKKPAKQRFVSNKRFRQMKRHNQRVRYNQRENYRKHYNRLNSNGVAISFVF